jgi:hypothetical protein
MPLEVLTAAAVLAAPLIALACGPSQGTPPIPPSTSDHPLIARQGDSGAGDARVIALDEIERSLQGVWCWANVKEGSQNAHAVRFSSDGKKMNLEYVAPRMQPDGTPRPPVEYDVEFIEQTRARMSLIGEDRTTDAGAPVVWDLIVLPDDRYCWHRTDWAADSCTDPISRCPPRRLTRDHVDDVELIP